MKTIVRYRCARIWAFIAAAIAALTLLSSLAAAERRAVQPNNARDGELRELTHELEKLRKIVVRQFGSREKGFFIIAVWETTYHRSVYMTTRPMPGVVKTEHLVRPANFIPVEEVDFRVIEGREAAVQFILDHMSNYPVSKPQRRSRRSINVQLDPLPPPTGGWRKIGQSKDARRAKLVLENTKAKYEAQPRWKAVRLQNEQRRRLNGR